MRIAHRPFATLFLRQSFRFLVSSVFTMSPYTIGVRSFYIPICIRKLKFCFCLCSVHGSCANTQNTNIIHRMFLDVHLIWLLVVSQLFVVSDKIIKSIHNPSTSLHRQITNRRPNRSTCASSATRIFRCSFKIEQQKKTFLFKCALTQLIVAICLLRNIFISYCWLLSAAFFQLKLICLMEFILWNRKNTQTFESRLAHSIHLWFHPHLKAF